MLSSNGPVPVLAELNASTGGWSCTFDQSLRPGTVDFKNWLLRTTSEIFTPSSATAARNIVSGASASTSENPGKASVQFTPPPADVVNAIGQPAFAFSGFPVRVT